MYKQVRRPSVPIRPAGPLWLPDGGRDVDALADPEESVLTGFSTLEVEPVLGVMAALLLVFCLGVGITLVPGDTLHRRMDDLRRVIMRIVELVVLQLLPRCVIGMPMGLTMNGQFPVVVFTFSKVVVLALALSAVLLVARYAVAGSFVGRNPRFC